MHTERRFRFVVTAALLFVVVLLAVTGSGVGQALAAPAVAGLPPSTACTVTGPATVTCELWAKAGTLNLPGSVTVPIWGYAASAAGPAAGLAEVPGPALIANAGDAVTVILHNDLAVPTALYFEGQAMIPDLTGVAPGAQKSYTFTATDPGTFLYEAGPLPNAQYQVPMGLYGALIVRPAAANQAYVNLESAFNDEALVVLSEIDPALNNSANPATFDLRNFKPKYWLINGKAYPQTAAIDTLAGHEVLLRYVNAGQQPHTMTLLGAYQKVLGKAGAELPFYRQVVSEVLSTGQSMDAIVSIPALAPAGTRFALYEGSMLLHNNGTADFGGMLTFLTIPDGAPGDDTLGPAASALGVSPNPTNGSADVALTASISDVGRGDGNIQAAEYFIDAPGANGTGIAFAAGVPAGSPTTSVSANITIAQLATLASGNHPIYVHGQDAVGNWGPFNSIVLNLDKTGPATSGISLNPATSTGTVNVVLQATGNDIASGNSNVTAAEYFIDAAGANGTGTAMTPNQVAPTVSFNATISAATMGALVEGAHVVHVHSRDALGNWGAFSTATLGVDKTGPVATGVSAIPSPNNGYLSATSTTQSVRVNATLSDPLSGTGGGIQSAVKGAEGFIDTVGAPGAGFAFTPNDGIFNTSSEVAYAFIPLSTVRALSEGPHTIYVRGKDAAGNWGATTGTSLVVDKTKPGVSGVNAAPNPTSGAAIVTLTATATDPDPAGLAIPTNIVRVEWFSGTDPGVGKATAMSASDGAFNSPIEAATAAINVTTWALGNYTLYVRAKDAAGNWSAISSTTLVVSAPPVYFSTFGNTNPPGVGGTADDADIYYWNGAAFSRVFDASTNGLPGSANVDGYVRVDATHFYVSFSADTTVVGLGAVQDEDIVYYNSGVWTVYFDGTGAGLTAANQDIDAFDIVGGVLYFSTFGNTNPPGVVGTADDADIYTWNGAAFSRILDASAPAYGLVGGANVDGYVRVDATHFYMSFSADTTAPVLGAVQDEDIVYYNNGVWSIYFDGTARGLTAAGQDIDAFDLP